LGFFKERDSFFYIFNFFHKEGKMLILLSQLMKPSGNSKNNFEFSTEIFFVICVSQTTFVRNFFRQVVKQAGNSGHLGPSQTLKFIFFEIIFQKSLEFLGFFPNLETFFPEGTNLGIGS
jgi:hypothetical protein